MGFAQKSAQEFFETVASHNVELLVDVRLNNRSQLAGFAKERDLCYLLPRLTGARYVHDVDFAPTKELLSGYRNGGVSWDGYVQRFSQIMNERDVVRLFRERYESSKNVLLLCSEPTPERCHRRLLAERISAETGASVEHL
jgi:uncharacterized protein (DUF488 family)